MPLYDPTEESFANEEEVGGGDTTAESTRKDPTTAWRPRTQPGNRSGGGGERKAAEEAGGRPRVVYSLAAADGSFQGSGSDITVLWQKEGQPHSNTVLRTKKGGLCKDVNSQT